MNRLLEETVDIDAPVESTTGDTLLHLAIDGGQEAVALLLLENGASANVTNAAGETPLHMAAPWATSVNYDLVATLLEAGADPCAEAGPHNVTPIDLADKGTVRKLLLSFADGEAPSETDSEDGGDDVKHDYGYKYAGHGDARLAQLEQLLSHDEWEPVEGREQLWAELEKLLLAKPELKTYLKVPAAIEIAVYNATDDERPYSGRH